MPELVINGADRTVRLPLTTGERVLLPSPQLYAVGAALSRSPAHGAADVAAWLHATVPAHRGWAGSKLPCYVTRVPTGRGQHTCYQGR
ncbi:hypothetical protein [Virgisporangium aurantiacum]|nr:hypothetical protein [Virgisporangium aurantiacum]